MISIIIINISLSIIINITINIIINIKKEERKKRKE